MFKATDGGESWEAESAGLPNQDVNDVVIDPTTPTTLWAATAAGLARSTDGAGSWTTVSLPADTSGTTVASAGSQQAVQAVAIEPARPQTVYVTSALGLVAGEPSKCWQPLDDPAEAPSFGVSVLAASPTVPGPLYVGTAGAGVLVHDIPSSRPDQPAVCAGERVPRQVRRSLEAGCRLTGCTRCTDGRRS